MDTSPDEIIRIFAEPLRAVRAALDHGVSFAETLAEEYGRDRHFYAHCVRKEARKYLKKLDKDGWFLSGPTANSAIQITQDFICCRVHMSQDGEPPHPGRSFARAGFYQQAAFRLNDGVAGPLVNLLLYYRVTNQQALALELCKPLDVWGYGEHPRLAWRRPIHFGAEDGDPLKFQPADFDIAIESRESADADEVAEAE